MVFIILEHVSSILKKLLKTVGKNSKLKLKKPKIKQNPLKTQNWKQIFLGKSLEVGALNPNSVLCTDQAPSPTFNALNPGSALNP